MYCLFCFVEILNIFIINLPQVKTVLSTYCMCLDNDNWMYSTVYPHSLGRLYNTKVDILYVIECQRLTVDYHG